VKLLSILTVTKAEPHVGFFLRQMQQLAIASNAEFVIAGDGTEAINKLKRGGFGDENVLVSVKSNGILESVLDPAVRCCSGKYILRIDDDECVSPEMFRWIVNQDFTEADHWKFSRAHLWHVPSLYITNGPLWPDHQTRLSIRKKSGGRTTVHAGSPFGGGRLAPVILEHWKFLVKTREERREIAERYDSHGKGFGTLGMLPFNVPEEYYPSMELKDISEASMQAVIDSEQWVGV
jgi:hypothetical protein